MNLFQALLHHCFVRLLKHLAANLGREKVYSLEFQSTTFWRSLSITFWEGRELVAMTIAHCVRVFPVMKSTVLLSSQLLSAVSTEPRIICCGGSSLEFIKALDKAPSQKAGMQYPFSLSPMHVEKLMHKPSFSVVGKIDMFSMLRTLLIRLAGLLDERWTQSTQYFRKVCLLLIGKVFHNGLFKALEEGKFDLLTVFLVVQEMLTHWPKIVAYINSTGPLQEVQHVVGRVSSSVLVPLFDTGCLLFFVINLC